MRLFGYWFDKTPIDAKFKSGQKVFCCATHEVPASEVCNGIVIRWAFKAKSYWAFSDVPSDWYKVQYENGKIETLPEDRLYDLEEYIKREKEYFESPHVKKWAAEGFQNDARLRLEGQLKNAESFLNE